MKVSEITLAELAGYLRLEVEDLSDTEKTEIETMLRVSKAFIRSNTGLTQDRIDAIEEFIIVIYILVADMYDNRVLYVDHKTMNKTVDTILGMHSENLL